MTDITQNDTLPVTPAGTDVGGTVTAETAPALAPLAGAELAVSEAVTTITEAADAEKKAAENEVHPVVAFLWAGFVGDINEFRAWFEAEVKKVEAAL